MPNSIYSGHDGDTCGRGARAAREISRGRAREQPAAPHRGRVPRRGGGARAALGDARRARPCDELPGRRRGRGHAAPGRWPGRAGQSGPDPARWSARSRAGRVGRGAEVARAARARHQSAEGGCERECRAGVAAAVALASGGARLAGVVERARGCEAGCAGYRVIAGARGVARMCAGKNVRRRASLAHARRDAAATIGRLTPREQQVLALLPRGLSNAEMAQELGIATGTVKIHVERILHKLGLRDRTQAAVRASEWGFRT